MSRPETERIADSAAPAAKEKEKEEEGEDDRTVFGREWERMDDKLLVALKLGDEGFVRRLFSPATEASVAADHASVIDLPGADTCRGVTVGGNSALHIVATYGHLELAKLICARDSSLLEARNLALETSLHCAASAGADQIVSLFISEARRWEQGGRFDAVLRATDREGKTALHAAAEKGHAAVVRVLVSADPGLAAIVDGDGVSPLYAAALSKSLAVVQILTESPPKASYAAGPNRQTALHAAAIVESPEIADKLLQWKPTLTKEVDNSRSTALHYLAITSNTYMMHQLLKDDASPAYLSDSKGFYPIHIAARCGRCDIIRELVDRCHDMDELVDDEGKNFLHIAIQRNKLMVVKYVCRHRMLAKMLNARDYQGNTPLHLAVSSRNQKIVSLLLENESVHLSIKNKNGRTPLDLAIIEIDYGLSSIQNPQLWIFNCLHQIGAVCGPQRLDHLIDENGKVRNHEGELKKYESVSQNLVIVSVLIATVTFAAAFTMPGGNIADDHQNGGTPTLARKYAFKVFIVSDIVAFLCSIMASIWLIGAGSLTLHPSRREKLILRSERLVHIAVQSMMVAFALSVYLVLAPVNILIAFAVCIFTFPSVLLSNPGIRQRLRLIMTLKSRLGWSAKYKGPLLARRSLGPPTMRLNWHFFVLIVCSLLVYILIFGVSLILSIKH